LHERVSMAEDSVDWNVASALLVKIAAVEECIPDVVSRIIDGNAHRLTSATLKQWFRAVAEHGKVEQLTEALTVLGVAPIATGQAPIYQDQLARPSTPDSAVSPSRAGHSRKGRRWTVGPVAAPAILAILNLLVIASASLLISLIGFQGFWALLTASISSAAFVLAWGLMEMIVRRSVQNAGGLTWLPALRWAALAGMTVSVVVLLAFLVHTASTLEPSDWDQVLKKLPRIRG
jgi:hypothetical protein